ncbi:MAG: hypothetical protein ABFC38_14345 [Methanospirillum sp.]
MAGSPWNHAPKRLWKRVSVYVRPDLHAAARERGDSMTLLLNNALARKYGLDPCAEGGARRVQTLRRLEKTTAALEQEMAALSADLQDDRLGDELRAVLEEQYEEFVALRDERAEKEVLAASRATGIREAMDAIIGDDPPGWYTRMLPENDTRGIWIDDWDALVTRVSRRCGTEITGEEVIAVLRRFRPQVPVRGEA